VKTQLLNRFRAGIQSVLIFSALVAAGASFGAGPTQADFPNRPGTAADCLAGRHWELVPTAKCVCDGDPTSFPVSNDDLTACVPSSVTQNRTLACPPPTIGGGTVQSRILDYMGIPPRLIRTGAWSTESSDCADPPIEPPKVCANGASNYPLCTFDPGGPVITQQTETQILSCPAPSVGASVTQTRTVTYTNGVATAYGAWSGGTPVCTGGPRITYQTVTQTLTCTPPSVGAPTQQERTITYTDGVPTAYGSWTGPFPTCTGVTTGTETQTLTCPPPSVGAPTQQSRIVTYSNGVPTAYGAWTGPSPTCTAPSDITFSSERQTLACPAGMVGSGTVQTRQVTYTNGVPTAYGAWTTVSNDCRPPEPPRDPIVYVSSPVCRGGFAPWLVWSAWVPQSQVANWYASVTPPDDCSGTGSGSGGDS